MSFLQPREALIQRIPRPTKALAVGMSLALSVTLVGLGAPAAHAAGGADWSTSFEAGQPQPLLSTQAVAPVNVTGDVGIMGHLDSVYSPRPNTGGEGVDKIADQSVGSKWYIGYAPSAGDPLWARYTLDSAQSITKYSITSANDESGRDPKTWKVLGTNDDAIGTAASSTDDQWAVVDTQTNQSFSDRKTTNTYALSAASTAYKYYRLSISANNGAAGTQLADWTLIAPMSDDLSPMTTKLAGGPSGGTTPNKKAGMGWDGLKSVRYAGRQLAKGASSVNTLVDGLNLTIGSDTELSYKISPDFTNDRAGADNKSGEYTYPSTYAALDLLLDDGSVASSKNLVDQYDFPFSAKGQGQAKALFTDEWNSVRVDLSSLAGRTVKAVRLVYDNPGGKAGTPFSGWVDDVKIQDATPLVATDLTDYVDTRRGTNSTTSFSRGTNVPATLVPNGFNFISPMTDAGSNTPYEYARTNNDNNKPTLQGIGFTHETSPWMGDSNRLAILPSTSAAPSGTNAARALEFSHDDEVAQPDYYSVTTTNGITAEVAPSDHAGVFRFTFPGSTGGVALDRASTPNGSLSVSAAGVVTGWVEGHTGGSGAGANRMFVYGQFDATPSGTGAITGDNGSYAGFDTSSDKTVELRIATSFLSVDQAHHNLDLEVTGKTFEQVQQAAQTAWDARLGVVDLTGSNATDVQKVSMYSDLYRLNMYPNSTFENTGTAAAPVYKYASPVVTKTGSATDTEAIPSVVKSGKMYVNSGFWDTYRTAWPMYSLLYPKVAAELVDGFVQQYRDGGWVSRWSSPGYSDIMTGTSSDIAFADAYVNGSLPTDKALDAYDAAVKNATVVSTNASVGRKGLTSSIFLGYTPDSTGESVSWALEGYINDDGIAQMAAKLAADPATPANRVAGLKEDAKYFAGRADNFVKMFNPALLGTSDQAQGFFAPRKADGTFAQTPSSYDPTVWWGPYTETDGWNFAFHAPFDVAGLAGLYGGSAGLNEKLAQFYATPELGADAGGIHEMLEARAVRIGQLGQSNQVSHHIPYISAANGDPATTQKVVREVLQRLSVGSEIGQGYLGDEDNGEMSAWNVWSALGFYPLALASGKYTVGSPELSKAKVTPLDGDGSLTINAPGNTSKTVYVSGLKLNGTAISKPELDVQSLIHGNNTLDFTMSATPSTWGTFSTTGSAPNPDTDLTSTDLATTTSDDGTATGALVDNTSATAATFSSATPTLTVTSTVGPAKVERYTLTTPSAAGSDPKAWTLEGSNDGTSWTELDSRSAQAFAYRQQTRSFEVAHPGEYSRYRLAISASTSGAPSIAEVELYAVSHSSGEFALRAGQDVTGKAGTAVSGTLASVAGGTSSATADYAATVDYGDGSAPQQAIVSAGPLGTFDIVGNHTYAKAGVYSATVSATEGSSKASVVVPITVVRKAGFTDSFNNACITVAGTAADCDGNGYAYKKESLASTGFVQGQTITVPGKGVSFDLPNIPAGQNDNLISTSAPVRINVGADATKVSFVGMANESDQTRTVTLTYGDGHEQKVTVSFDNWDDSPATFSTNVEVGSSSGRYAGTGTNDGGTFRIWSTAPVTLDAGHGAPLWLTMSAKTDTGKAQLHLFAVASDGTRTAPAALVATGSSAATDVSAERAATVELASFTGGDTQVNAFSATVNWGDGTPVADATVAGSKVLGTHTFARPGTYTATVTVDDSVTSTTTTRTIVVGAKSTTPAKTAVSLSRPVVSASSRVFGASKPVTVTTSVSGATSGTVTFTSGATVLGKAAVVGGKATLTLPSTLAVGTYAIVATLPATSTTLAGLSVASAPFSVVKAAVKKVKVKAPKKFAKGKKLTVKVKVSKKLTNGLKADGKVKIYVGKKVVKTISVKKLLKHKGKVVIKAKFLKGKKVKVKARFVPKQKATTAVTTSAKVVVKRR